MMRYSTRLEPEGLALVYDGCDRILWWTRGDGYGLAHWADTVWGSHLISTPIRALDAVEFT